MSVRYDPLLIDALAREIEDRWAGTRVWSLGMDPGRSAAAVRFADRTGLLANLQREAGHLLAVEDDPLEGESVRNTHFTDLFLSGVHATLDERSITLTLHDAGGDTRAGIALELQTNRWNVLCLEGGDGAWRVRYALWTREIAGRRLGPGERYAPPASRRRGIERKPDLETWRESLDADPEDIRGSVLRTWAWSSALNIGWVLGEGAPDPAASYERYLALREVKERRKPGAAWLSGRRWGRQPYPLSLGDADAIECSSLLAAMARGADAEGVSEPVPTTLGDAGAPSGAAETDRARLGRRLRARQKRARKRLAALCRQLEAAGTAEESREIGQLILVHKDDIPRGRREITLESFDGSPRVVTLDPALDAVANARRHFEEARRRERAHERLPAEIARGEARLAELTDALERFDRTGPDDALWALAGGRPSASKPSRPSRKAGQPGAPGVEDRLPYTRLLSSGGLEIRVGRGAHDNDDLTFRHSAPDDIWLHASQASGAHVVLRWGRRDENPPQRDLIDAATAAAVHSAARHSGAVQVVWTRRKHVRKPRKSPPGTVTPDRVRTLIVAPDADLVRKLREGAR